MNIRLEETMAAKKTTNHDRLEEVVTLLVQSQAALTQNEAALMQRRTALMQHQTALAQQHAGFMARSAE
jgi:hypothetical protein